MQRFYFVHFVLAEDEGDDQNTHRPSGRLKDGGKIRGGLPSAWIIESEAVAVAANQVCTS